MHAAILTAKGRTKCYPEAPRSETVDPWMYLLQFLHPRFGHIADRPPTRCVG